MMTMIIGTLVTALILAGLAVWAVFYYGKAHQQHEELEKKKFFVTPQENTVFASVAGNEDPIFGIASRTKYLAEGGEIIPRNPDGETIPGFAQGQKVRKWDVIDTDELRKLGIPESEWPKEISEQLDISFWGRYWTGLWPFRRLYFEELEWVEWKNTSTFDPWERTENTFFLYVKKFGYGMMLIGAETDWGVPVNLKFTLIVRMVNPHVAWFENEDWKKQLDSYVLAAARRYVGNRSFRGLATEEMKRLEEGDAEVRVEASKDDKKLFTAYITALNLHVPRNLDGEKADDERGVVERLGAFIESAQLERVDLTPEKDLDEAGKATRLRFIAEQKRLATIQEAKGEQKRLAEIAIGEKQRTVTLAEGRRDAAKLDAEARMTLAEAGRFQAETEYAAVARVGGTPIRVAEHIRDSNLRTFATGSSTVLALAEEKGDEDGEDKSRAKAEPPKP